jgi:hypothetical protein
VPEQQDKHGFFDLRHPFYRPIWIRIAIVASCLGWAIVEFYNQAPLWGILFGAVGVYCAWGFFIAWDKITALNDPGKGSK